MINKKEYLEMNRRMLRSAKEHLRDLQTMKEMSKSSMAKSVYHDKIKARKQEIKRIEESYGNISMKK